MNSDIDIIKRKMLVKYPFFGKIIASVTYKESLKVPTAATDGNTIYYNPSCFMSLSTSEKIYLITHEICHIAFNHILRSEGKNQKTWNLATDAVVNAFLKKDGLALIKGSTEIEDAINYDAEELYNKLLKDDNEKEDSSSDKNKKQNTADDGHEMWQEVVNNKDNANKSDKESITTNEKNAFEENKKMKEEQLNDLKEELLKSSSQAGTSTNENVRIVSNIEKSLDLIDWRYILKETIKYDLDWSYKNANIEYGVVCSTLEEIPMPETEILVDTSGSVDETLLKNFLKECKNILKYTKLKIGCFDTKFYDFHVIRNESDIDNMTFQGGGGTDFDIAVNAFTRRCENKIIFTDGEAQMPIKKCDAIWIVFGNSKIEPIGGKVIYVNSLLFDKQNYLNNNYKTLSKHI